VAVGKETVKIISEGEDAGVEGIPQVAGYVMRQTGTVLWKENWKQVTNYMSNVMSQQLPESRFTYAVDNVYEPKFDLDAMNICLKLSGIHMRCVYTKAGDVAGGWSILPNKEFLREGTTPSQDNYETLYDFFSTSGEDETFLEQMNDLMVDYESIGYGMLEVGRNRAGLPTKVWHIPANTVRVLRTQPGYLQRRDQAKTFFQRLPDKAQMKDGKLVSWNLMSPKTGNPVVGNPTKAANELLMFKNYSPLSERYGLPDFLPAIWAILGNMYARDYNLDAFDESMIPAYAIIVTGGTIGPETRALIQQYFEELRGTRRSTLIVTIAGKNVKVEFKKLERDLVDASFKEYLENNRNEIMLAHGVHPARIGIVEAAHLGAGSGTSQLENYKRAVIEPRQRRLAFRINEFIVRRCFGIRDWKFVFEPLDVRDKVNLSKRHAIYLRWGVMSPDEVRQDIGMTGKAPKQPAQPIGKNPVGSPGATAAVEQSIGVEDEKVKADGGEVRKAAYALKPLRKARVDLMYRFQDVIDDTELVPGMSGEDITTEIGKTRDEIIRAFAAATDLNVTEAAEEIMAQYGVTWEPEEVEKALDDLKEQFGRYVDGRWMKDFEQGAAAVADMSEAQQAIALGDLTKKMSGRSGAYSGVLWSIGGVLAAAAATKSKKKIAWQTAGADACPDCQDLESAGPYDPGDLQQMPGDGRTKCRGNCRCVLELVG